VDRELKGLPVAKRSRERERDYGPSLGQAPLPEAVDLRRPWHTVSDQGRTASCVGWTVADSVLRWHLVEAGRLAPDAHLSARHVWMAAKETDQRTDYPSTFLEEDGTSLKAGLDVVRKYGAALETGLPWSGTLAAGAPQDFNADIAQRRITAYYNLGDDSIADRTTCFDGWRRWLFEHGPIAVLIKIDKHIQSPSDPLDELDEASVAGSHGAALFGYDKDSFLLRSSWGPGWRDGGYVRMSLAYTAAAVIESYGVTV
jgi:Papain family cysteine protease